MSVAGALTGFMLAAAPLPQAALVLDCYVMQSDRPDLGRFVRHLEVHPNRGIVVIADALRSEPSRFIGNARLITLSADRLVFDFASRVSSGRTQVNRSTGNYRYTDGRVVISGSCQVSDL